jgi:hypothetical protein
MKKRGPNTTGNDCFFIAVQIKPLQEETCQLLKVLAVFLTIVGFQRITYDVFNTNKRLLLHVVVTGLPNSYTLLGQILVAFAKLRIASSCLSALPSVFMEQLGSHWTDFNEILYARIFPKSVEKIGVLLKSDKYNGRFT